MIEYFYINYKKISAEKRKIKMNFNSTIQPFMQMKLQRKVSVADIKSLNLNKMPGFLAKWYVTSGMDKSDPYYDKNKVTIEFARNFFNVKTIL